MRKMKLSDIKISKSFANSVPNEEKMNECRNHWNQWHRQDRFIVISHDNVLIDGYVQYLILKESGIKDAEVIIADKRKTQWYRKNTYDWKVPHYMTEPTIYVYGIHSKEQKRKERVWRVPNSWKDFAENVQVGDTIFCNTIYGKAPIVVTRVETLDKCPVEFAVKKVASRVIRRNGSVISNEN